METKRFQRNDSGFVCRRCGAEVPPLRVSSRDHCNVCLWSIHIDVNPGDRACGCLGGLEPVTASPDPKKGYVITYRCDRCGEVRRCKAAPDDDRTLIIELTSRQFSDKRR